MLKEETTCPCLGERSNHWHDTQGLPRCDSSRAAAQMRKQIKNLGLPPWKPGTDIEIPEFDPL